MAFSDEMKKRGVRKAPSMVSCTVRKKRLMCGSDGRRSDNGARKIFDEIFSFVLDHIFDPNFLTLDMHALIHCDIVEYSSSNN